MPKDRFGREIDYLRISVIDHCNLRCVYCMPLRGLTFVPSPDLLTAAEIETVARAAVEHRLPEVPPDRRGAHAAAGHRRHRRPHRRPPRRAGRGHDHATPSCCPSSRRPLKAAGLTRINIHVDTLDPERLKKLMRFGSLEEIEAGIAAAEAAGLRRSRSTCVVTRDYNDMDVADVARRGARARMARALHRAHAPRRRRHRARRPLPVRALAARPASASRRSWGRSRPSPTRTPPTSRGTSASRAARARSGSSAR